MSSSSSTVICMCQEPSIPDKSPPSSGDGHQGQTDMTVLKDQLSSDVSVESLTDSAPDQSEWDDWGVDAPTQVSTSDLQSDNTLPRTPFVYDGTRDVDATRRKNIVLFGETGVGKSSVINLMAGAEVAQTSSKAEGCTMAATEYSFTLPGGPSIYIYDTVGLNEPEMAVNSFFCAIEKAHKLVRSLYHAGGIDLLVFCIRGGRVTSTMQRNYSLFAKFLCESRAPLALVVTHLEHEDSMENWWKKNEKTLGGYGIQSVAHACVTAVPARVTTLAAKRAESQSALLGMLRASLGSASSAYVTDMRGWFTRIVDVLWSFLPEYLRRRALSNKLISCCALPAGEAQRLAHMLTRVDSLKKEHAIS